MTLLKLIDAFMQYCPMLLWLMGVNSVSWEESGFYEIKDVSCLLSKQKESLPVSLILASKEHKILR